MESLDLPADSNSVKLARAFVGRHADQHLADPFLATLLTSELVANVVRHARTSLRVSVTVGHLFGLRWHDGVAATAAFRALIARPPPPALETAPSGRGLSLVHDLASRVGVDDDPDGGKVVWFEL